MTSESPEVIEKYKEILVSNGITNKVSEVIVKDAGLQGEGMISRTLCATIRFEDSSVQPLNLFVKAHMTNPAHRAVVESIKAFEKEATFLTKYLPDAREFCKSKGKVDLLSIYPKCYFGDETMIVLENLVLDKGFVLLDKMEMQSFEEAKVALITLAKHHAIAYAMLRECNGAENFFAKYLNLNFDSDLRPNYRTLIVPLFETSLKNSLTILKNNPVEGGQAAAELIRTGGEQIAEVLLDLLTYTKEDEKFIVLNHGDYWNNNMLFIKSKETNEILDHKVIDFQISRYNSSMLDLSYYLFMSVKPEVRRNHLHSLLQLYLQTLKEITRELGYPVDITDAELFHQFRKKFKHGFWNAFCVNVGPGQSAFGDVDISSVENMTEFASRFDNIVQKWIEENPEKGLQSAKDIVELMNEYNELLPP